MRWDSGALTCAKCRPGNGTSATPLMQEAVDLGSRGLLNRKDAARYLGVSVDHFDDHVRPNVKERRVGSKPMFTPAELDRFADGGSESL